MVRGNSAKFLELMHIFMANHGSDMVRLTQLLADDDRESANRLVHSLKGTAATLGGERIASMARDLENALRQRQEDGNNRQEIQMMIDAISVELSPLAAALCNVGSNGPSSGA